MRLQLGRRMLRTDADVRRTQPFGTLVIGIFELGLILALVALVAFVTAVLVVGVVVTERRAHRPAAKPPAPPKDAVLQ